jgi:hypothetical protein
MQRLRPRAALAVAVSTLSLLAGAVPALAAPSTVTVRVEGDAVTRVARTTVTTNTTPVSKDGDPSHSCPGTSGIGALELATGGDWSGSWSGPGFGYFVQTIKGETHSGSPDFWSFWVNYRLPDVGACSYELQPGDEVLFFPGRCEFDQTTMSCTNPPIRPLRLFDVPRRVERGAPFTVRVVRYDEQGVAAPTAGVTVAGGGTAATTDGDGRATLSMPAPGETTLQAAGPNYARTAAEPVCVYVAAAGGCDVPAPAQDTRSAVAQILGIRDGQRFAWNRAPRLLRGTTDPGAAGVHRVRLRLRREVGRRCWFYSGKVERLRKGSCRATHFFYGIGDRPEWSYLLAVRPPHGRYVLEVTVMDRWGRVVRDDVRFSVARRPR